MQRVVRWVWLLILILGLISLVFGIVFIMQGQELKSTAVDSYSRSEGVDNEEDIEIQFEIQKERVYKEEDREEVFDLEGEGPNTREAAKEQFPDDPEKWKVASDTTLSLYGVYGYPNYLYIASRDGMIAYGMGKMMLGTSKQMFFTGILNIVIGIALMLVAFVVYRTGRGMTQIGKGLTDLAAKVAPPEEAPAEVPAEEAPKKG